MSRGTAIQWADDTVNPLPGCSRISPGCGGGSIDGTPAPGGGCYAERMAWRLSHNPATPQYHGTVRMTVHGPRWTGLINLDERALARFGEWRRPRRIFVESMGDLHHENVGPADLDRVYAAMDASPHHTYLLLTKRADRMAAYLTARYPRGVPRHLHPGASVESQAWAEERVPELLRIKSPRLWLSCEPLLGSLDLDPPRCPRCGRFEWVPGDDGATPFCKPCGRSDGNGEEMEFGAWLDPLNGGITQVVMGGESGPGARSCDITWLHALLAQCRAAGVAAFVKQVGSRPTCADCGSSGFEGRHFGGLFCRTCAALSQWHFRDSHGGDMDEWPEALRVREFPEVARG